MNADSIKAAREYHQRTKHHFQRFADSLGYMDWDTQPDPFRRYEGAPLVELPFPPEDATCAYDMIYQPGAVEPQPVSLHTLSEFYYYGMALSAQKAFGGNTWSLRVNPSSGNLHPTESYIAIYNVDGLGDKPAVYHYASDAHGLERRTSFSCEAWQKLSASFPPGAFLAGLTSIHWRESWKYGERAWRYCQHDCGHALAALRYSAAVQGWGLTMLMRVSDDEIARLLGLDRDEDFREKEHEAPDLLAVILPQPEPPFSEAHQLPGQAIDAIAQGEWHGKARPMSHDHHDWPVIEAVHEACYRKTVDDPEIEPQTENFPPEDPHHARCELTAARIIRMRRSAQAFDSVATMPRERFYDMLFRVVPTLCPVPWDALPRADYVHLGLFVHRVTGLAPGLYALARNAAKVELLKAAMHTGFLWQKPDGCPDALPLFLLQQGDVQRLAMRTSCGQDIAGDSIFSLGMLAEFDQPLQQMGAWFYRRLFWETGVIGQVLYLEAEASAMGSAKTAALRGTGIGCFFDDPVHEVFGMKDTTLQSLYHFTTGGPLNDPRLLDLPPYPPRK